ncbi:MAG: signal recognition particle protein Srp19 [Candidatus Nezhaarchaeota archaeon]|nr:signal recognition particle protein Srp19 [Candidatus Nezhaarchaeota archaeon]MCX8141970.1 signal recognition particle protein Srp19 [Candidatus Nezhaarchaeota archaeon]MDW8050249.1 signal recognition particle subunit SRP19/SEC65 family protein [Nitrososphaerota archaeon]
MYPCYFDSTKSESQGRKIPKRLAVPSPRLDEIFQAAKELNLDPMIEEKPHPSWWWEEPSRISVKKITSKKRTLFLIAQKILEKRGKHV